MKKRISKKEFAEYLIQKIASGKADKQKVVKNIQKNLNSARHTLNVIPRRAAMPEFIKHYEWHIEYNQYALEQLTA